MASSFALPDELGDVITVAQAHRFGISRGRLDRHPQVRAPFAGIRIRVQEPSTEDPPWEIRRRTVRLLARAYAAVMPPHAFFSHSTAAEFLSVPLPLPDPALSFDLATPGVSVAGMVEASVLTPHCAVRAVNVRSHELPARLCATVVRDGLRISSPASTWAMLADRLSVDELVAVGDALIRRPRVPGRSLAEAPPAKATLPQLSAAATAGPRTHVARLRVALPQLRQGSSSDLETYQRLLMLDAGLPEPALDHDVYDDHGTLLGCSEIAYPRLKIAVECEGDHHRTDRSQWNRDIDKYQAYVEAGWLVVRSTGKQIRHDTCEAARRVEAALLLRGWRPGSAA